MKEECEGSRQRGKRKGHVGQFWRRFMVIRSRRCKHAPVSVDQVVCDALRGQ